MVTHGRLTGTTNANTGMSMIVDTKYSKHGGDFRDSVTRFAHDLGIRKVQEQEFLLFLTTEVSRHIAPHRLIKSSTFEDL